ncbi:MAG: VOC family protein [Pseudomonadota bacterium]
MTQSHFGLDITRVALRVNDIDRMVSFYEDVVGLAVFKKDREMALLGVGVTPLLELRHDAHATRQPTAPGLYHTAFLLPSRGDLGAWLGKAIRGQVALDGAADHGMSEAVYLSDPEGNGIEIYADRPEDTWKGPDGKLRGGSSQLSIKQLLSTSPMWKATPVDTRIGHVHLQVGNTDVAREVFAGEMGLDVMTTLPGMSFFSEGGYHHHFGANTHRTRGVPRPDGVATGLMRVDLEFADRTDLPAEIEAPWGTSFAINRRQRLAA